MWKSLQRLDIIYFGEAIKGLHFENEMTEWLHYHHKMTLIFCNVNTKGLVYSFPAQCTYWEYYLAAFSSLWLKVVFLNVTAFLFTPSPAQPTRWFRWLTGKASSSCFTPSPAVYGALMIPPIFYQTVQSTMLTVKHTHTHVHTHIHTKVCNLQHPSCNFCPIAKLCNS